MNLLVAAITLWNTAYLERVVTLLQKSQTVETALLQHVLPFGWGILVSPAIIFGALTSES